MKQYELKRFSAEIKHAERKEIKAGCAIERDTDPQSVATFRTLEEAREELKKAAYAPSCYFYEGGRCYEVTEYGVEIYEADEGGEFISGSDFDWVQDFSFSDEVGNNGGIVFD